MRTQKIIGKVLAICAVVLLIVTSNAYASEKFKGKVDLKTKIEFGGNIILTLTNISSDTVWMWSCRASSYPDPKSKGDIKNPVFKEYDKQGSAKDEFYDYFVDMKGGNIQLYTFGFDMNWDPPRNFVTGIFVRKLDPGETFEFICKDWDSVHAVKHLLRCFSDTEVRNSEKRYLRNLRFLYSANSQLIYKPGQINVDLWRELRAVSRQFPPNPWAS